VMPCSIAVGYQCFGVPCCLHLQGGSSSVQDWCWKCFLYYGQVSISQVSTGRFYVDRATSGFNFQAFFLIVVVIYFVSFSYCIHIIYSHFFCNIFIAFTNRHFPMGQSISAVSIHLLLTSNIRKHIII